MAISFSQILFQLSLSCVVVILWRDPRVPRFLAFGMLLYVIFWFVSLATSGNLASMALVAFAINVISFLAFLLLIGWFLYFWNDVRKEPAESD